MESPASGLRTDVAHSARIYDFLLGGKDNFAADREAAERITAKMPHLPTSMRAARAFNARLVHHLVAEHGIRQFLDVGTGLPTSPNLHEVAQRADPTARVVYVDNDPLVLVHARALLTSTPEGRTAYLDADLHDPDAILAANDLDATLDLSEPVAVMLMAILQYVADDAHARRIVDRLMQPMPAGSVLAVSTVTADTAPKAVDGGNAEYRGAGIEIRNRTHAEVSALFDGLDLIDPGVTLVHRWRPDEQATAIDDAHVYMYGGAAVKR